MKTTLFQNLNFLITHFFKFILISKYNRKVNDLGILKPRLSFIFICLFITVVAGVNAQLPIVNQNKFQQVDLLTGLRNSTTMKFAPDGRIFILDRYGELLIYKTDTQTSISAGSLSVFHELEDGLLGIAFDPNFQNNSFIYLTYSPAAKSVNRVSRFKMDGDDLNLGSESILLEWVTSRTAKFHSGGGMDFDSQGNLYIATGDNAGYDNLYAAWNEDNSDYSAEKSSSNTNDLRGKILRIKPTADGGFTIPTGNLFPPGTPLTKPEIYVMGARNPYRIFVDKEDTDWLFWGDVGPDASKEDPNLGPEGLDEINLTQTAGNYGWPYFAGQDNDAYGIPYRTPAKSSPAAPENKSKWNTGAKVLPPAKPAWIEIFHKSFFAGPRYHYDSSLTDAQRLPIEFDSAFFYYDFNTSKIWAVKMDAQGNIITNERFAPGVFPGNSTAFNGFIDMAIGPDGKMYILAYGAGCCPQNVGTGRLIRVDYTGITTNAPPNVKIAADKTNGSLDLTVQFSSEGTTDPNGDMPLFYEWDVDGNGTIDYIEANPTHTYTVAGTYEVQLRVRDGKGGVGVNNITIHAGNNATNFTFIYPPDGGLMNWQDDIDVELKVTDDEDGAIDCEDVKLVPSLGHLNHFHDELTLTGCPTILTLDADNTHGADGEMDIFYVLNANYTDSGGLTAFDQIQLHPKRKEAEFFDTQNGTTIIANTDPLEGGAEAVQVNKNGYISFSGRNLHNIKAVKYKVASAMSGGTIELRVGGPNGLLLAATRVPSTGGLDSWVAVESEIIDPGGKNDLFFVFKHATANQNIFHLNYVEFMGEGVSKDNSPPLIGSVEPIGTSQVKVVFTEYVTKTTAEQLKNYMLDNGISITSAVLQSDGRTVILNVSPLRSGVVYNLKISNVQNLSGMAVVTGNYTFSTMGSIRINVGGPETTLDSEIFSEDKHFLGGKLYANITPIAGTDDDALYQTERYGSFSYAIPVPVAGEYDIRLHFAELYFGVGSNSGAAGDRIFSVSIEGVTVLNKFDILAETDPATALKKEFNNISVTDGVANIQFTSSVNSAKLSGIEILSPDAFKVEPKISILSPQDGWNINETFEVSFSVENWTIAEGDTHMHYSIDGVVVGPHYNYGPITIENQKLGSHIIRLELYTENHIPTGIYEEIMIAVTDQGTCNTTLFPDSWVVHQLEANSYTAVYTIPDYDLNGDGLKDIVTGGWWYKNPGSASGNWVKSTIGNGFGNVVHVYDFDGDGHMDLLGTALGSGAGNEYKSAQLLWAKNDGSGNFTVYNNIPAGKTTYNEPFLAGIAGGNYGQGVPYQMAINWNGAESTKSPVQLLTPSNDPSTGTWTLVDISNDSSGEDIKAGDIDGDGDLDLFQGINWLRNEGNGIWTTFSTGITYVTTPDRVQLADFNGDGRLDGVVGQLGLGSNPNRSEFAWFEAPADPTKPWIKHKLSDSVKGSLSVFAIDIDFDGDMDIVVGEWLGSKRLIAFENDLCNSGTWITRILDDGTLNLEHHDGAMVTDIDNDGDLDVISNGWLKNKVPRIYENTTLSSENREPVANAGEDQTLALPANSIVLNGTGSDVDGGIVTFMWTQTSGPDTATLSGSDTKELTASNLIAGDYVFRLTVTNDEGVTTFDEVTVSVLAEVLAIRINSGGPEYTFEAIEWSEDQYFSSGSTFMQPIRIANTANDQLYQTERYLTKGNMVYNIPVASGIYDINLHFAEIYFGISGPGSTGGEGSRVFNVNIENGQKQLSNYDIIVAAGGSATAVIEHFTGITVDDGFLTITFTSVVDFPKVSGIEVMLSGGSSLPPIVDAGGNRTISLPSTSVVLDGSAYDPDGGFITSYQWSQISGPNTAIITNEKTDDLSVSNLIEGDYVFRLTVKDDDNQSASNDMVLRVTRAKSAVRINSGGPDLNFNGEIWNADQYFLGGTVSQNPTAAIANTENDALYQTERFSTSTDGLIYEIPVENGLHNISLHFAEIYFAVAVPASAGGVGSRVFHIDIENGTQRIDNYDIVIAAGGAATAVVETFLNILVTDGNLTVKLIPVKQFPKISGLEIVESRSPSVNAGLDQTIVLPVNTITQNGSGSDPDGGAVTFLWTQISGPNTASLIGADTPNLTANNLILGTYVFNLMATDDENNSSSDQVTITVVSDSTNMPPAVTNPNTQTSVEGDVITLQISATDPEAGSISYAATGLPNGLSIDATTGLISGTISIGASSNSPYTVEVTVVDDGTPQQSTMVTFIWNVTTAGGNQAPVAIITADEIVGTTPFAVSFTGSNSTDDIGIISYFWDFKDGSTSEDSNPIHIFDEPGTYTVELTVSDGLLTDTESIIITVNKFEPLKAIIAPNPAKGIARVYVLNATSKDGVEKIYLHDTAGKFIETISNPQVVADYYAVPVHTLQNGVYYLTLMLSYNRKLLVELVVQN
ncbi:malectin domain-containing carbohydrate-binding protein [Gelidibacter salicanalis]|uniref:PQQ-dependent sugar dehydrogenase n=1 Tax=Gelidibacter salicanalis TaxID=291193 RepID=A0A934KUQ7_9FLAO|nr:malectin domain-containing carbohydrate-binding protein [Gelidibacter salicanalis]MBJ7881022.1 PQQ-dependent sugar dehydrogenase [Gelidibacter salicanalis]